MNLKNFVISACMICLLAASPVFAVPEEGTSPLSGIPSFAPIVEKTEAAVVNISAVRVIKAQRQMQRFGSGSPFEDDFFERFLGPVPRGDRKEQSLGSGFIFDPAGYIVTNNHVIEGAEDITVKLSSGEELKAEVIGRDPKTDLALIKLKKEGKYPFLALGDSDKVKVGDWVVAIGNPMGLDSTVTAGILSARGRSLGIGQYEDFLQTDASINPGNSGGPLLNLSGEVIGINSAIASIRGGGNIGISFAIPTNLAKGVVNQLKEKGKVVRGWLGVQITKVTPDLAKSLKLDKPRGALVTYVDDKSPAGAAKVKHEDIILNFDGKDIRDFADLSLAVANTEIGKKAKMTVFRDGKEVTLDVTVGEMKDDGGEVRAGSADSVGKLGLTVKEITPEVASKRKMTEDEGVFIAGIEADSPAGESGLNVGDIILEIDGKSIKSIGDYRNAVKDKKKDDILRFLVVRGAGRLFFTLTVGQ